ncbi:MAG: diguanylate cyclase [Desulfobacterales bacterium]|nr:diguanylate cyclase [Desulfobacterales bacterium]
MQIKFHKRISVQQAKNTVIVALLIGITMSIFQISNDLIKEREQINSTISQVISMFNDQAALAAYSISESMASEIINGLFKYQSFCSAKIMTDFGIVLAERERPSAKINLNWLMNFLFENKQSFNFPLKHKDFDKQVGSLVVSLDNYLIAKNFISRSIFVIITDTIQNIILSFILGLMFYYSLTLPLLKMAASLSYVDPSSPASKLLSPHKGHLYDEFGLIVSNINKLLIGFEDSLSIRRAAELKYRNIFESAIDGIYQATPNGQFLTANPAMAKILGYASAKELIDNITNIREQLYVIPENRDEYQKNLNEYGFIKDFETKFYKKDRTIIHVSLNSHVVKDENQNILYYEGILDDITKRKKAEEELMEYRFLLEKLVEMRTYELTVANKKLELEIAERMKAEQALQEANHELQRLASLDGLTQLANRRIFDERFIYEWKRVSREKNCLSLILCDVDFFKLYNDTYGHQLGDSCLCSVAKAIMDNIRRPADLAARYGGEEFVVILPNTDVSGALHVAELIQHGIAELKIEHLKSKVNQYVTLSIGVATVVPNNSIPPKSLIELADKGLYEAKAQGRNRIISKILDDKGIL